jgi:hypothetical protein
MGYSREIDSGEMCEIGTADILPHDFWIKDREYLEKDAQKGKITIASLGANSNYLLSKSILGGQSIFRHRIFKPSKTRALFIAQRLLKL